MNLIFAERGGHRDDRAFGHGGVVVEHPFDLLGYDLVLKDHERFVGVLPDTTLQELSDVHTRLLHACLPVSHACVSGRSSTILQYVPVRTFGIISPVFARVRGTA